jgi:aminomethyltransferase
MVQFAIEECRVMSVEATAFHARTAEHNRDNAWCEKNGFTVPAHFGNADDEALSARLSAVVSDISWRWRVAIAGDRAADFLSKLTTKNATSLETGTAHKALWLNDGGAVRGAGAIVRTGEHDFVLVSAASDKEWITSAAKLFAVNVAEPARLAAGLAVIGPYATHILMAAELTSDLAPLSFVPLSWRGLDVFLSRIGEHGGFEIWCQHDDAVVVWDRIMQAGRDFALRPAGALAMETLDIEAGVPRPWRDFTPACDAFGKTPTPEQLSLVSLIDTAHMEFNGRLEWLKSAKRPTDRRIVGLTIASAKPIPFARVLNDGRTVGRTLTSRYSPHLRCAIALAEIDAKCAAAGCVLSLTEPLTLAGSASETVQATVTALPFLPSPDPIGS